MHFQTPEFALFLIGTLVAFYLAPRRWRLAVLSIASLVFYAASGLLDFALLSGTIVITYGLSRRVMPGGRKWPIAAGLLLLFGSLAYFKYSGFIYEGVNSAVTGAGGPELRRFAASILPLGISFYTLQAVAYLIDLYRGKAEQSKSLLEYMTFSLCFPQLIAGPIMRASDYLPQLRKLDGARLEDFRAGGLLILTGLVKKVVIADWIALRVDFRFAAHDFSQADTWIAAALFAFQVYFDFSGYVDMALGIGRLFGLRLKQNFFTPYLSRNGAEFWRRWHVTLSEWFRDYVYVPLGGGGKKLVREALTLLLVMGLIGLWHGAGWTFVAWGGLHGAYLAAGRFWPSGAVRGLLPVPEAWKPRVYDALAVLVFFNLVLLAWVPFRAADFSQVADMYRAFFSFTDYRDWAGQQKMLVFIAGLFALHMAERYVREHTARFSLVWGRVPAVARGAAYAAVLVGVMAFYRNDAGFSYFKF